MSRGQYENAEVNALWFTTKQRRRVKNYLLGLFKKKNIQTAQQNAR